MKKNDFQNINWDDPEFDFEKDIATDPDALDEEWLKQPMVMLKYSLYSSHCQKLVSKAHEKVKTIRSELLLEVSGTQQEREAKYRTDPKYLKAKKQQTIAEYNRDMALNAVSAVHQKRGTLEHEVKLWLGQYFAGPVDPRILEGGKRGLDESILDKASKRQREGLNKDRKSKKKKRSKK